MAAVTHNNRYSQCIGPSLPGCGATGQPFLRPCRHLRALKRLGYTCAPQHRMHGRAPTDATSVQPSARMPFVIGTDEAGYGPHFGPLCISATVWELDDGIDPATLYKHMRKVVANCVDKAAKKRVVWADSKAVYKNGCGMDHLERGVMAALALIDRLPGDWSQLWHGLDPQCVALGTGMGLLPSGYLSPFAELPWHIGYCTPLPIWMNGPTWMNGKYLAELADC